jgi:hypothetical protein
VVGAAPLRRRERAFHLARAPFGVERPTQAQEANCKVM